MKLFRTKTNYYIVKPIAEWNNYHTRKISNFVYQTPSISEIDYKRLSKEERNNYHTRKISKEYYLILLEQGTPERDLEEIPKKIIILANLMSLAIFVNSLFFIYMIFVGFISLAIVLPMILFLHGINDMALFFSFLGPGALFFAAGTDRLIKLMIEDIRSYLVSKY